MKLITILINKFYNSIIYHHLYYKHTKRHKKDLNKVRNDVMKRRKEIIGK